MSASAPSGAAGTGSAPARVTITRRRGPSRRMRYSRRVLMALGIVLLAWGSYVMVDTVNVTRISGLALWTIAAIIIHDAIIGPALFVVGLLLRRGGQKLPGTVIAVVQGTLVVGSIMTLIVLPIFVAQNHIPLNPSILPLNYALNLAVFWLALIAAGTALSVALYLRAKRANDRPSSSQV
ncbi:MAG: hypothetical protein R6W83_10385 [Cryobacterium sp.]